MGFEHVSSNLVICIATVEAVEHGDKSFALALIPPSPFREARRDELGRVRVLVNVGFWRTCFPNDLFLADDERLDLEQGWSLVMANCDALERQFPPVNADGGRASR